MLESVSPQSPAEDLLRMICSDLTRHEVFLGRPTPRAQRHYERLPLTDLVAFYDRASGRIGINIESAFIRHNCLKPLEEGNRPALDTVTRVLARVISHEEAHALHHSHGPGFRRTFSRLFSLKTSS